MKSQLLSSTTIFLIYLLLNLFSASETSPLTLPTVTFQTLLSPNGTAHLNEPFEALCLLTANRSILEHMLLSPQAHNFSIEYVFLYHGGRYSNQPLVIGRKGAKVDYPAYGATFADDSLKVGAFSHHSAYPRVAALKITPLAYNASTFSCQMVVTDLKQKSNFTVYSNNKVTIKILPQAVLSTNVTVAEKGEPFTATCKIAIPGASKFTVNFYKRSEGLLASYEVIRRNQSHYETVLNLVDRELPKNHSLSSISAGFIHHYPTFELRIIPATAQYDLYWCEVVGEVVQVLPEKNLTETLSSVSTSWPLLPVLRFEQSPNPADQSETVASCTLHNFALKQKRPYSVLFRKYYHIFPQEWVVATFTVDPSSKLTTVHYDRKQILGTLPVNGTTFAIKRVTTRSSSSTDWYCELQYYPEEEDEPKSVFGKDN